jgi:hypothetical protein
MRLKALGDKHQAVALTVKNLGLIYRQMDQPDKALKYLEKVH